MLLLLLATLAVQPATSLLPAAVTMSPLAAECLAGYIGGVAKQGVNHPFELIATMAETRRGRSSSSGSGSGSSSSSSSSNVEEGSSNAVPFRYLARHPLKLYSGFAAAAVMNLPYAALFHTSLFFSSEALNRLRSPLFPPSVVGLLAGAIAAASACVVGVPLEVVKHRMQVTLRGEGYETPWRALRSAVKGESERGGGLRGLYTGLPTTLLRNVPYNAVQFGTFRLLMSAGASPLVAGASAGVATAIVTTPIDVVNTRMQTQAVTERGKGDKNRHLYAGPLDAVRTMLLREGPSSFWRGVVPRTAGYAPSALVFFWIYRAVNAWAGNG